MRNHLVKNVLLNDKNVESSNGFTVGDKYIVKESYNIFHDVLEYKLENGDCLKIYFEDITDEEFLKKTFQHGIKYKIENDILSSFYIIEILDSESTANIIADNILKDKISSYIQHSYWEIEPDDVLIKYLRIFSIEQSESIKKLYLKFDKHFENDFDKLI